MFCVLAHPKGVSCLGDPFRKGIYSLPQSVAVHHTFPLHATVSFTGVWCHVKVTVCACVDWVMCKEHHELDNDKDWFDGIVNMTTLNEPSYWSMVL